MPLASNPHELELLTDDVLREIASLGQLRKFQKNVAIIQEGDTGDSLYIILAGKVKVQQSIYSEGPNIIISGPSNSSHPAEITSCVKLSNQKIRKTGLLSFC